MIHKNTNLLGTSRLLKYLFKNKVASRNQIQRDVFPEHNPKSVTNKLFKLKNNKLIERHSTPVDWLDKSNIYSLSKKGFNLVKPIIETNTVGFKTKSDSIFHDLILVDIRNILIKSQKVKNYYTENEIQSQYDFIEDDNLLPFKKLNFDSMLVYQNNEGLCTNIGIQFERSKKSLSQYNQLVKRYYFENSIDFIIYVHESKSIEKNIKKFELDLAKKEFKKIFFIHRDNLFSNPTKPKIQNQDNYLLRFY